MARRWEGKAAGRLANARKWARRAERALQEADCRRAIRSLSISLLSAGRGAGYADASGDRSLQREAGDVMQFAGDVMRHARDRCARRK